MHDDGRQNVSRFYVLLTQILSLNVEIDNGFYTVKFDSQLLKDAVVEADSVIPPLREDDPLSSDSDLEDTGDDVAYAKGEFEYVLPLLDQYLS